MTTHDLQRDDGPDDEPDDGTVSWRALLAETTTRLAGRHGADDGVGGGAEATAAREARWIVEEASGLDRAELVLGLDEAATTRGVARLDDMVARRLAGEPIQYVLGHWPFRALDLLCDRRTLIPRPETEQVVEHALAALDAVLLGRPEGHRAVVVDLGAGTGAIGLAIATERPGTEVWLVDRSPEALGVARANLAGLGMAGARVRVAEGEWFEALPPELAGTVDLVVTNPPYVAAHEELPAAVADWEPTVALVSGPSGLEAYEAILAAVPRWLAGGGAFVAEIGATQAREVVARAAAAGLEEVTVAADHAGLDRAVVARRP